MQETAIGKLLAKTYIADQPPTNEEIVDKVNEIIDCINEIIDYMTRKELENDDSGY